MPFSSRLKQDVYKRQDYTITVTFAVDTDKDGTPDKYDRTLTYDANGGYFGSEGTTEKTETGLNDGDRHTLKSTDEYHPCLLYTSRCV